MILRRLYSQNNLKPAENINYEENGSSKSLDLPYTISGTGKVSENSFMSRLREMEKLNTYLEKLAGQRSKKLTEVVATNTKFLSIIAHDLRSPFCSILGVLEILKGKLYDFNRNEIANYIDIAYNSANNTLNLLDNLLTWTISQNNEKNFNPVKINLLELSRDEIENVNTLAKQKQITLNHSIAPDLNIAADLQMVKTVFRNLIGNAVKYTNTGGKITVSASKNKHYVEIEVKDNGIGIPYDVQRKLFKIDAFHSTAGTNNEKGSGLGLLLCKEFIEMHGGNIWIKSEPGKGSKFMFTLPLYI